MAKYIDKSALIEEIERLSAYLDTLHEQRIIEKILSFINTLEVKEEVTTTDALIDKACEWLRNNIESDKYLFPDEESYKMGCGTDYFETNMFIEDFKKAMKGGNNE